jgi:hypothetical protein
VLDPISTINAFNSYTLNLFGGLTQVSQNARSMAEESRKAVRSLVVSLVDSARRDVQTLVNRAAADIWTAVNDSAIGTAVRIEQCGKKGIQTVAGDAFQTSKYFFKISCLLKEFDNSMDLKISYWSPSKVPVSPV